MPYVNSPAMLSKSSASRRASRERNPREGKRKLGDGRSVHPVAVVTQEVGTELPVRLREPDQSPRYTLRVFDDASQCAGDSNQPFDPGRVGSISELEPVPLTAPAARNA